jgi:hypothetical protein
MSTLRVDNITGRTGSIINVPTGTTMYAPGSIVQVVNTYVTATSVLSVTTGVTVTNDIPGIAATITPKSINSKIYITARWFGEFSSDGSYNGIFGLKRNTVPIGLVTNTYGISSAVQTYTYSDYASTPETLFLDCYDSPASISSLTYQLYLGFLSSSQTVYTNRTVSDSGGGGSLGYERGTSSITLFEIAG